MLGINKKSWVFTIEVLGFWMLLWAILGCSSNQDEGREESSKKDFPAKEFSRLEMKKCVTKQANFVLYLPNGWDCNESLEPGFRTLTVTDPGGLYKAIMFYGSSPLSNDLLALAKHFNKKTGRQFPDFRIQNAMISQDEHRIVFDGFYTDSQKVKREFRCWLSGHDGDFIYSSVEAPEGKLAGSMQKLLTILTNIRVTKGAFKFKGVPTTKVSWGSHRLRDGSASFLVPKNWRVQELGAGQFIANDPSGVSVLSWRVWKFLIQCWELMSLAQLFRPSFNLIGLCNS